MKWAVGIVAFFLIIAFVVVGEVNKGQKEKEFRLIAKLIEEANTAFYNFCFDQDDSSCKSAFLNMCVSDDCQFVKKMTHRIKEYSLAGSDFPNWQAVQRKDSNGVFVKVEVKEEWQGKERYFDVFLQPHGFGLFKFYDIDFGDGFSPQVATGRV